MTKIAFTTAAILISVSAAFAGSDKFGSNDASQPAVTSTDNTTTASIHNPMRPSGSRSRKAATATSSAAADLDRACR
ncbi:DUF680 domain-containing protein [Mesorhizobium sp.]|uniref:DUF680 domain-containing protein n=1 Tax=Mesorhizobium sp. TaxID=1871066 RepID=UPI002600D750|nr:DUF680 domain-containing protein [Mesorhizobium sp.]